MIAERTCRTVSSLILRRFAAHTGNKTKRPSRTRRTGCGASEHGGERRILARTVPVRTTDANGSVDDDALSSYVRGHAGIREKLRGFICEAPTEMYRATMPCIEPTRLLQSGVSSRYWMPSSRLR